MGPPEVRQSSQLFYKALAEEADIELARRSLSGCLLHFVLLMVVAVFTPYFHDHPRVIWTAGSALFFIGVLRLWLATSFASRYSQDPAFWRTALRIGTLTAAVAWGTFCSFTVPTYGSGWVSWFILLITTGIAAGASASLAPDYTLFVMYVLILLGPTAVWSLLHGAIEGRAVSAVVALYLAYLLLQGLEQSKSYWRSMTAGALLKSKTSELEERSEYLKALIEGSPLAIVVLDTNHRIQICNEAFEKLFLYPQQEAVGKNLDDLLKTPETASEVAEFSRLALSGEKVHATAVRRRKDGTCVDVELHGVPLVLDGKLVGLYALYQDITYRKQAESKLQEANQQLGSWVQVLEKRSDEITFLSEMGNWLQSCQTADEAYPIIASSVRKFFPGYSGALCMIAASKNLVDTVCNWGEVPSLGKVFAPDECWAIRRGKSYFFEIGGSTPVCQHVGNAIPRATFCLPLMAQGEALGILYMEAMSEEHSGEISSKKFLSDGEQKLADVLSEQIGLALANLKLRDTLRNQSVRDALTGLFNRRYLEESLERELSRAKRNNSSVALLMIDVDHFKQFNDTSGHQAGDALLREMGALIKTRTRGQDIACRYGGEEFALVLTQITLKGAIDRAEKLRQEVRELNVQHGGQSLGTVSISVGVALFPEDGSTADELIRNADDALYRAKHEGRDRVVTTGGEQGETLELTAERTRRV